MLVVLVADETPETDDGVVVLVLVVAVVALADGMIEVNCCDTVLFG